MKPALPKGTRDFSPVEMARRNFILNTIRDIYQQYGYQQIETPAMENLSTLEGKYGEEGDKLLFRILNSGNISEILNDNEITKNHITEKGLRYDLTVPFARYMVMHQNEIVFPFKRFQMQPVWRADRPQKGRYREFYQCDADVIGSDSLLNETELIIIIQEVFLRLGIEIILSINNRKILSGIAETMGGGNRFTDLTAAIDKLDKAGIANVKEELFSKNFTINEIEIIEEIILKKEDPEQKLDNLKKFLSRSVTGQKGLEEIKNIFDYLKHSGTAADNIIFDVSLARGLNYYTGAIFEVKVNDSRSTFKSSLLGGGRYDNLTGIFGLPGISGVGISFGIDRIYDVMNELNLFDETADAATSVQIMFTNFGKEEELYSLKILQQIRAAGIHAEIYPDAAKMKKQMAYADAKKIPFVALAGTEEMKASVITLKNMQSGEQQKLSAEDLIKTLLAQGIKAPFLYP